MDKEPGMTIWSMPGFRLCLPHQQDAGQVFAWVQVHLAGADFFRRSQRFPGSLNSVFAQNMGWRSSATPVSSARILGISAAFVMGVTNR